MLDHVKEAAEKFDEEEKKQEEKKDVDQVHE